MATACFRIQILTILWLYVLPNLVFGQLPRLNAISGNTESEGPGKVVADEAPVSATLVFDETPGNALIRYFRDGEWYFSWGMSREAWAPTNIRISQPSQGNEFTIYNVRGVDDGTWSSVFGGQYNIRVGRFVDEARSLAVEFSLDHTKYATTLGQTARVAGTIAGKATDATYRLDEQFFAYKLHNGANHVMINLVKRLPLIGEPNEPFSLAAIGKVGIGIMLPHAENIVMGNPNDVGKKEFGNLIGTRRGWWQIDGWTTGVEFGLRFGITKHIYLEITDKVAYARLDDIPVFQGTAGHNLWMNEVILSIGVTYGAGR